MANNHIDLDRRFSEIKDDVDLDPESVRWSSVFSYGTKSWDEILAYPRVVILAEAGVGKTDECKAQARKLADQGQFATFCPVEDIAQEGFPACLSAEDDDRYQAWLATEEAGYLLLDSVDEAKLANHPLDRALRKLAKGLGRNALDRMHVVVTCRVSDWRATADRQLISEYLPLPRLQEEAEPPAPEFGEVDWNDLAPAGDEKRDKGESSDVLVVGLTPLNASRIKTFVSSQGVKDVDAFMQALGEGDLWEFAERPQDLLDLIAYWDECGQFGTHTEMMALNIDQKLKEASTQPVRRRDGLDLEQARVGAQAIAAAMTLCHRSFVVLPDAPVDLDRRFNALAPEEVLPVLGAEQQGQLLTRPLFDEGTYGRTQFHHRSTREFLAAKWLMQRLLDGHRRSEIERMLFDNQYGVEVVIPSMAPVLGWLANWDESIRKRVMAIAPEVLIAHGDPEALPTNVRADILRQYAAFYADQRAFTGHSFDRQSLKRIAHVDLAPTMLELFNTYSDNHEVTELLLRIAREGGMAEVADVALRLSLDEARPVNVRANAIRAIGPCGATTHHSVLTAYLLANAAEQPHVLSTVCVESLFPQALSIDDFMVITSAVGGDSQRYRYMLEDVFAHDLSLADRSAILAGLLDIVEAPPHVEPEDTSGINASSNKLAKYIASTMVAVLNQAKPDELHHKLITRALDCLGRSYQNSGLHVEFSEDEIRQNLRVALLRHPEVKHAMFWGRVEEKTAAANGTVPQTPYDVMTYYDFWQLSAYDLPWLTNDITIRENSDERALAAVSACYAMRELADQDKPRAELFAAVHGNHHLEELVNRYLNPTPWEKTEDGRSHAEHNMEYKRKMDAIKQARMMSQKQWGADARANLDAIRCGEDFPKLHTITKLMGKVWKITRWGHSNWDGLIPVLGQGVAEAGRDGLKAFWRTFTPELRSERTDGDGIKDGTHVGLCGLAIEHQDTNNWAESLNADEAGIVTRYATWEMNGFPDWLPDLVDAHPNAVRDILAGEIEHELRTALDALVPRSVLSALEYGEDGLRELLSPTIQELVMHTPPTNPVVLDQTLHALLRTEGIDKPSLGETAAYCVRAYEDNEALHFSWLVAWYCLNANGAQDYVDRRLEVMARPNADAYVMALVTALFIHGRERRFGHVHADYNQNSVLERMLRMVYAHVRLADDNEHEDSYTPDTRDDAESARSRLLSLLCEAPGKETYETLLRLSDALEMAQNRDVMLSLAKRRAEKDCEPSPWRPAEVVEFAAKRGKAPISEQELFELTLDHLDDIRRATEDGDYSHALTFVGQTKEEPVQMFFADELDRASRGHYTLEREPEVVDKKKPDIRVKSNAVKGPVSIEIKVADSWSGNKLLERLENQLVGQYLRAVRSCHGILLLTYHGVQSGWDIDGKRRAFPELLEILQEKANTLKAASGGEIAELLVLGVDFTKVRK